MQLTGFLLFVAESQHCLPFKSCSSKQLKFHALEAVTPFRIGRVVGGISQDDTAEGDGLVTTDPDVVGQSVSRSLWRSD